MAEDSHVLLASNKNKVKSHVISSVISLSFGNLISEDETSRIKHGTSLVEYLIKNQTDENNQSNLQHSLKRLIRGVGSTTSCSRAGFFAPLVAYFKVTKEEVNISEIFTIVRKELITGGSKQDKSDPFAYVGRILVCGALIKSEKLILGTNEEICEGISMLITASQQKKFHSSLAYTFLIEFMSKLKTKQFKNVMWPLMREELTKPCSKHNIDTLHFIIAANEVHPSVVSISELIDSPELICSDTYASLGKILFEVNNLNNINHPIYEIFGNELAKSKNFLKFWSSEVDQRLKTPTRAIEIILLKFLTTVFQKPQRIDTMSTLMSKKFISMLISTFTSTNKANIEFVKDFYNDFFESFIECVKNSPDKGSRVILLNKFILNSGHIMFDSVTSSNIVSSIVSSMDSNDIKQLIEFYKGVVFDKIIKNKKGHTINWTNSEKMYAVKMIQKLSQHTSNLNEIEWRTDQMVFLLNLSVFNTEDGVNLITKPSKNHLKNVNNYFFQSLETKFPKLENEKDVLFKLVEHVHNIMSKKKGSAYLKVPLDEEATNAWNSVYIEVLSKGKKSNSELKLVFDILLMHMGLQLFNEPKIALDAIEDLKSCINRVTKKCNEKKIKNNTEIEPEWIEVIVDLFLHLLSQNSSPLRTIITKVFPGLCSNMTLSAMHQILSVLNMNEESNPLTYKNQNDDEESDDSEYDEDSEDQTDKKEDVKEETDNDDSGDDDDSDADDVSDDDVEEEEDENNKVSEELRNAVTLALQGKGMNEDDDTDLDLNDLDISEGNTLDKALSLAFQLHSQKANGKKKNKRNRIEITTVGHFRMRVLDLLEIYFRHNPKMSFTLEIMLTLFEMLCFCIKDKNELINKVKSVFNKLLAIRKFSDANELNNENLAEILKNIIDKKIGSIAMNERNLYLEKCGIFIINCSQIIEKNNKKEKKCLVANVFEKYLLDFILSRTPAVPFNVFTSVFNSVWTGIWQLTNALVENIVNDKVLSLRRSQTLGLFAQLYKNNRFILSDMKNAKLNLFNIENEITKYIADEQNHITFTPKIFNDLLILLIEIKKFYTRTPDIENKMDWNNIGINIQIVRKSFGKEIHKKYAILCNLLNIEVNGNIKEASILSNGVHKSKEITNKKRKIDNTELNNGNEMKPISKKKKKKALNGEI